MQRVETAERKDVIDEENTKSSDLNLAALGRNRFAWILVGSQVLMMAGLVWLGHSVVTMFDHYNQQLAAQNERTQVIADQTAALSSEFSNLRQYLASRSEEDVIFLKAMVAKPSLPPDLGRVIAKHVHRYSNLYGQDPDLVLAMIAVESNFNPNAVSHMGAVGLMQVMPQWKKVLGIEEELSAPDTSIKYGLQILGFYKEMYKDLEMALTAYNRGPGPVDMALMRGRDPTNEYAPRVMKKYRQFKSLTTGQTAAG